MLAAIADQDDRAVALTLAYVSRDLPIEPLRDAIEDLALFEGGTRPIVVAHATKATIAAFDRYATIVGDDRMLSLLALVRFLSSPIVERNLTRITHEAIGFVTRGETPRVLSG